MVFKKGTTKEEVRVAMRQGPGEVHVRELTDAAGRPAKCRVFSEFIINPGCGIGEHPHVGETEFYYIIAGSGVVCDNGTEVPVSAGDTMSTGNGSTHSITNTGSEPMVVLGCVVLD
ncbi:MAG: cupin domain-containing protein [Clostridia bacterium]|nr:cupin domain-containing protein [Clostridia bacterium]